MPDPVLFTVCFSELYGTQRSIISLASSLDPSRYVPIISAPESNAFRRELETRNILFEPLPFAGKFDFSTLSGLKKIIKKHNVSLIHANLGISAFLSVAASRISPGIPVIITRHITDDRYTEISDPVRLSIYKSMYSFMNSSSAKIVFPSFSTKNAIEKRERGINSKGVVVPNGIFVADYGVPPQSRDQFRKLFGISENDFLVACVSRLSEEKQVNVLIAAAAIIKNEFPECRFIVAGEGPLKKNFEKQIEDHGLKNIFFLPGYMKEIVSLLNAADLYAHCCPVESFGLSVLEAMASGAPVICARGGGPMEIITDGVDGVFFEPGNAAALADNILELKNNPSRLAALKDNAFIKAAEFDMSVIAARYMSLYDSALGVKK